MAARAICSGTISFGMVSIPVKLYSTADSTAQIRFNMLRKDGSRLKQQYISAEDGEVVEREDRVKGYEFAKGQFVLFTEEEMKAMDAKSTNEISIHEFVPADQVSQIYVEKTNFLGPDKGAAKAYHLLAEAMRKTGRSAIATYAARGKQYLVMIHPLDDGIIMVQLRHAHELRSFDDVDIPDADVKKAELDLAVKLVEQVSSDTFEPGQYRDEVREHMLEMIDRKVQGEEVVAAPQERAEGKIVDIMEALKASLDAKGAAPRKKAKSAPKKQAKKKTAARKKKAN